MRLLRGLVLSVAVGMACLGASDLNLEITVPRDLVSKTEWFEVGAYKSSTCKTLKPMLANGLPEGVETRVAFKRADRVGPRFGDIPSGKYAFAAVARDKDCQILARGCVDTDVSDTSNVNIQMDGVETESGKCGAGASCQAGKCVPANNNADPSVGAACSLELLGAGPLLNVNPTGFISAPAIAPTNSGFVIVYRQGLVGDSPTVVMLPIDTSGGAYGVDARTTDAPNRPVLPVCEGRGEEADGVALLFGGERGVFAVANNCAEPSFTLANFSVTAGERNLSAIPDPPVLTKTGAPLTLAAGHIAARRANNSVIAFTQGGIGKIAYMDTARGVVGGAEGKVGQFGGSGITDAWLSASDRVLALLAAGTGAVPRTRTPDGGGGGEDETGQGPSLRLMMLPPETAPESITPASGPTIAFPGSWGSIATIGTRVLVLSNDTEGPGRSVTYRAFDLGNDSPASIGGFEVEGEGAVTAGDVAIAGNRAFFAVLRDGSIELHAYDSPTVTPSAKSRVVLARESRISGIKTIKNGRVAVAATDSRVAVAWTSTRQLDENTPAGGYAVFACTP